jgi:hypothetical protein
LSWSQCDDSDCVVVVAVVAASDDLEPLPPLAAIATPAPPKAMAVTAVARRAVCFGRNTENLLSVVVSRRWNTALVRRAEDRAKKFLRVRPVAPAALIGRFGRHEPLAPAHSRWCHEGCDACADERRDRADGERELEADD